MTADAQTALRAGPADTDAAAGAAAPVVRLSAAQCCFGARKAVDGLDLSIAPGEIYALLGPNGAGKTTIIRAISGRIKLTGGYVSLNGSDPRTDPAARRALGLVPQDIALYAQLTARENLSVFGRLAGAPKDALGARVDDMLRLIGLDARADERVSTLSGGMKRRVNIAAAALHDPKLLLLDEPTVGVDMEAREAVHDILRALRRRGMAMLLTTHDMDQAADLADRVGVLMDGRMRLQGAPADLIRDAFGDAKEIIVTLHAPPADRAAAALRAAGLKEGRGATVWAGRLAEGYAGVAALSRAFAEAGAEVDEIRVREPGLRGVYFQAVGQEFAE